MTNVKLVVAASKETVNIVGVGVDIVTNLLFK